MKKGEHKKEFDWNLVEALCMRFATQEFIAERLLIAEKVIPDEKNVKSKMQLISRRIKERYNQTFVEFSQQKREGLKQKLLDKQISMALDHDSVPLLIWLGKNVLGQTDKSEVAGKDGKPLLDKITIEIVEKKNE